MLSESRAVELDLRMPPLVDSVSDTQSPDTTVRKSVNRPGHRTQRLSQGECIDVIEDVIENMSFNIGASMKHLWRASLEASELSPHDLRKAIWYINREIERVTKC